jgi:hypothetical protein
MCGGRGEMTATTDKQLKGAKKKASVRPGAEAAKDRGKKSKLKIRGLAAAIAGKSPNQVVQEKDAANRKCGREISQAGAKERNGERWQGISTNGFGAAAQNEENLPSQDAASETSRSNSERNCNECGNAVKPLTEAGKKRLVNRLLGLAESQAAQGTFKITPADLIRLMQLHREMNPLKDHKVTVQWIEDRPE